MTIPSFILPPAVLNAKSTKLGTPGSVARKRRMAEMLMANSMSDAPISSPWQGFGRMAQALVGGLASRRADEQDFAIADADKKEKMARLLKEDQWRESGRAHEWGQDAFNNARARGQDAMARTQFQDQQDELQRQQDQRNAQRGVYEGQINQTNTHQGGMQGPQQPSYSPQQFGQAQMYAAGGDYGKAGELLNPIPDPMKPTNDIQNYEYGLEHPGFAATAGSEAEYGLQPIVTQEPPGPNGEPGKYHLFQANKAGGPPKEIPLPYGWTPQQQYLDTGLGFQAAPRQGIGNGAVIPKNVAEEAALREGGKQSEAVPAQAVQDYLKPNGVKEQDDATLSSIQSIHDARKMLETGIQTGALADKLQSLRSLGYALGFEVDERVLIDTETYQNFIRQTVIPKMKELGGNDSNEELRKMELLSGADITQQDETLRNTLNLSEKLLARKFKSRDLYRKATKKYFGDTYEIPELPVYDNGGDGGWTVLPNGVKIRQKGQ
jgi:hypothetical protein